MAIALVQQKAGSGDVADSGTLVVTLDAPHSVGNVVVCLIGWGTSFDESPPEPVDDGSGENWRKVAGHAVSSAASVWVRDAGSDGFSAVTVTNNAGAQRALGVVLAEFSGLSTTQDGTEKVGSNAAGNSATAATAAALAVSVPALHLVSWCARDSDANELTIADDFTEFVDPADAGDTTWGFAYKIIAEVPTSHVASVTADVVVDQNRLVGAQGILSGTGASVYTAVRPVSQNFLPLLIAN